MKKKIMVGIQIAFTYVGTVVGAGFASGQEILQFFTLYGSKSLWGIALCICFFSIVGIRIMILGHRLNAPSYQVFNRYILGSRWGEWMNAFIGISLLGVTSAMMSGVGSLFQEQLGLSFHFGIFCTVVLSLFIIYRGMDGLISINSLVVPFMFLFILIVFIFSWKNIDMNVIANVPPLYEGSWLLSALSFVAFNVVLSQAVLVPLGARVESESSIHLGGWLGGLILGVMVLICNFVFLHNVDEIAHLDIPMAFIIGSLGIGVKYFFLCVVWAEIFTTLVGNIFGLGESLKEIIPFKRSTIIGIIFLFSYICSFVGFPTLVGTLYPVFGYCGMLLIICLIVKPIPKL